MAEGRSKQGNAGQETAAPRDGTARVASPTCSCSPILLHCRLLRPSPSTANRLVSTAYGCSSVRGAQRSATLHCAPHRLQPLGALAAGCISCYSSKFLMLPSPGTKHESAALISLAFT